MQDRNDAARPSVTRLLQLDPEHFGGRALYAELETAEGRLAEAERTWLDLLHDYPEDADLYGDYGALMLRTLHVDKARALAAEGLRHEPEHPWCLALTAICDLIDGRNSDADRMLGELARAHPEHVQTGLVLVTALHERGDSASALRVAQGLLRADPTSSERLELVQKLRMVTHWSMRPLYPIVRWGWKAVIAMWVVVAFGLQLIPPDVPKGVVGALGIAWLVYVVYSWVWPGLLRRLI
jgi:predicted Zn-dependent protease